MTLINIADAEKNLAALIQLLTSGQQDKIILTENDEVVAELISPPKKPKRYFGMFKDEIQLAPDFDEWFDAMDAEILK